MDYIPKPGDHISYFSPDFGTKEYPFIDEIKAGESFTLSVPDFIFFDSDNALSIAAFLNTNDDENSLNDEAYTYVVNSAQLGIDLRFVQFPGTQSCIEQALQFDYYIINESCSPVAANIPYRILVTDEADVLLHEENLLIENILEEGGFHGGSYSMDMQMNTAPLFVTITLEVDGDIDVFNNVSASEFSIPIEIVNEQFLNTFTTEEDLSYNINYETLNPIGQIRTYQGEKFLAVSGDAFSEDNFCSDPFILFDNPLGYNGLNAQLDMCTDLNNKTNPTLKFDLVQFTDDDHGYPDLITCLCRLSIRSANYSFVEYYYGLEEGELNQYSYDLPQGFYGEISLQFYTKSLRNSGFFQGDVILIDNLAITGTTATDDQDLRPQNAVIFPNPTSDILNVRLKKNAVQYSIVNSEGVLIKKDKITSLEEEINLNLLSSGYYILNFNYEDTSRESIPFAHIIR